MEGKKTTALDKNVLHHTDDPPTVSNRHLKPTTRKTQGPGNTSETHQSKKRASRSRGDGRDRQYMNLDDDNRENDDHDGRQGDDEGNTSIEEANDQINSDVIESTEDVRDDDGVESESESFVETYQYYQSYVREATRREAEEELLRNKRELIGLPAEHKQNDAQQIARRFCTWALRHIKKRFKVLEKEEAAKGEDSGSD